MNRPSLIFILFVSLMPLSGCFFTGVESTPPITARDVKREVPPSTPEDVFLAGVGDAPLAAWEAGKEFMVTDPRITRIFGASASGLKGDSLTGKVITFVAAAESPSPTGGTLTDLIFTAPGGNRRLTYRVNRPLERLLSDSTTEVPFTIQLSSVNEAAAKMEGNRYWILTSLWRDDADTPVKGRKFIPVTIDSVRAGNQLFPLKVAFTDPEGHSARVFIYPGAKGDAARTFSRVFSFTDPRLRYPHISPEHWQLIVESRVTQGMTTEECRLALGTPKEVERGATNSFLREAWLYDSGVYLLFEDGILKRYRH